MRCYLVLLAAFVSAPLAFAGIISDDSSITATSSVFVPAGGQQISYDAENDAVGFDILVTGGVGSGFLAVSYHVQAPPDSGNLFTAEVSGRSNLYVSGPGGGSVAAGQGLPSSTYGLFYIPFTYGDLVQLQVFVSTAAEVAPPEFAPMPQDVSTTAIASFSITNTCYAGSAFWTPALPCSVASVDPPITAAPEPGALWTVSAGLSLLAMAAIDRRVRQRQ